MNYPNTLAPKVELLVPGTGLGERADASLEALHAHGFVAGVGLTEAQGGSFAVMAGQRHIREMCPNDLGRFGTPALRREWQSKGRGFAGIYDVQKNEGQPLSVEDVLAIDEDELQAVVWGWSGEETNKHIKGADVTTAYRVGERGRELARERGLKLGIHLGEVVLGTAVNVFGAPAERISLEAWEMNSPALAIYDAMGFEKKAVSKPEYRPTMHRLGDVVNAQTVQEVEIKGKLVNGILDHARTGSLARATRS